MIQIRLKKQNGILTDILVDGHSGYEEIGKDIVCASVSSMLITTVNAIIRFQEDAIRYVEDDGHVHITIQIHDRTTDLLLENMISLFEELQHSYLNYIKIIK